MAFLRVQRRNNRMLHQRRPELSAPLAQPQQPWQAYPDIPLFEFPPLTEEERDALQRSEQG